MTVVDDTVFGTPCTPWIDAAYLEATYPGLTYTAEDPLSAADAAEIAGETLYVLSGRQFPGSCETTVRPCRTQCSCFGQSPAAGLVGPWGWGGTLGGSFGFIGPWWVNECGDRCGCGSLSTIRLYGAPVTEILEVKIDGAVLDPSNYRLDSHRDLVGRNGYVWPACQRIDLDDTERGTFSVKYTYGLEPPLLGKQAAAALAAELWKAVSAPRDCKLPAGITRIVRQGITVEKVSTYAALFQAGSSGIPMVDLFLAESNPTGARRPPAVYSPDLPEYPREVGA